MTKILVDVDDDALSEAAELLGTKTKKDTVNTALRETVERLRRARAYAEFIQLGKSGMFDVLRDKRNYRSVPGDLPDRHQRSGEDGPDS